MPKSKPPKGKPPIPPKGKPLQPAIPGGKPPGSPVPPTKKGK